jgi:hypothetical protein
MELIPDPGALGCPRNQMDLSPQSPKEQARIPGVF